MKKENVIRNPITVATNSAFPSLRKGKSFKALIFIATKVLRNLAPGAVHTVPLSLIRDLLKIKMSNNEIVSMLEDLEKTKVDWSAYNRKYRGYSYVIPSCRYDEERDVIDYSFDALFIKEFLDERTPFKNIPLDLIMGFRSNYALKIYELAYQYYDPKRKIGKTPDFSYEDLREIFGLGEDQYTHKGHFFTRVINGPIKEAVEISDFLIDFHHNNRRGSMRRYWFTIKENKQAKFSFALVDDSLRPEKLSIDEEKSIELEHATAKFFLEFWKKEFGILAKKPMTRDERKIWIDPLLGEFPYLSTFSEIWLLENYMKPTDEKMKEYNAVKTARGL